MMPGQVPPELHSASDELLMALVARGEVRAFETLFDRHAGAAFSLAYRMCRRRALAEDVVQDAFLSVWRSGRHYQATRGSVRSWLLAVVHHRAIDALRRTRLAEGRLADGEHVLERLAAADLTDGEVVRREEAERIRAALRELPAEQRRPIELAFFGGLTHRQIARALGLPDGTVKSRIRLGMQKLHAALSAVEPQALVGHV